MQKSKPDEKIDIGILTGLLGYHVRVAQITIFRDFVSSLAKYDITPAQFGTLVIIELNPGVKQTDLAKAIQLDRSTVVPLIDRLEKNGYVARKRVASDRRTNALGLTKKGAGLLVKLKPLVIEHEQGLTHGLTKVDQKQLVTLLNKISRK